MVMTPKKIGLKSNRRDPTQKTSWDEKQPFIWMNGTKLGGRLVVSSMIFMFHFIYGMSSFPLTNSYFSRWLLHHQPDQNDDEIP